MKNPENSNNGWKRTAFGLGWAASFSLFEKWISLAFVFYAWGLIFFLSAAGFLRAYEIHDDREVSPGKPVNISASQLTFDRLKSLTLFKGNVKATHGKEVLTSDEIRAVSQNREATAAGHVKVVDSAMSSTLTCGNLEYLDQMNTMTAHDHPLMVSLDQSGRPISIQGRQMELDSQKKTVVINQNVQIIHESGRAEAQKATFLSKENQLILEEDPKVFVNNGQLSGRRIVSDLGGENRVLVEGMAEAYFNLNGPATVANGNKKGTASTTNSPLSPGLPVRGAHSPANPQEPVSLQSPDGSFGGTRNGISDSSTSSGENKK